MILAIDAKKAVDLNLLTKLKNDADCAVKKAIDDCDYRCNFEIPMYVPVSIKSDLILFLKSKGYKIQITTICDSCGIYSREILLSWSEAK